MEKQSSSTSRSDKGGTHQGFKNANMGRYQQPTGKKSGFCEAEAHKKCLSLACSCECHEME